MIIIKLKVRWPYFSVVVGAEKFSGLGLNLNYQDVYMCNVYMLCLLDP